MTDPAGEDARRRRLFVVVGESLIDLVRRPGQPEVAAVGGSPLNVAVGLSRLDVPVALWTRFGTDEHGRSIALHLQANGVGVLPGATTGRTSTAAAHVQRDGSAHYEFDIAWDLEPVDGLEPVVVHTGSLATMIEPGAGVVRDAVIAGRRRASVSYDPNVRPQMLGAREDVLPRVEAFVGLADVVKASDEDLGWLYPDQDVRDVARRWLELGPAVVMVTRGGLGAFAITASVESSVIVRPVDVVDTIGAGDSFMAGALVALNDLGLLGRENEAALRRIGGRDLEQVLTFAARCAAITVSRPGADPPRRASLPGGRRVRSRVSSSSR